MEVVAEEAPGHTQIIRLISAYIDSGRTDDFYAIQDWMAKRDANSAALSGEIMKMLEKVTSAQQKAHSSSKASQEGGQEGDQTAEMAEMFAAELEVVRADSDFTGSQAQMEYLRDILNCGENLKLSSWQ